MHIGIFVNNGFSFHQDQFEYPIYIFPMKYVTDDILSILMLILFIVIGAVIAVVIIQEIFIKRLKIITKEQFDSMLNSDD